MTYTDKIHSPQRTKELFFELVAAAKARGLVEEKFSFRSLFMDKQYEGKACVVNGSNSIYKLIVGEKMVDGKTMTYVKFQDRTFEWNAEDTDPVFKIYFDNKNVSIERKGVHIFDSDVQNVIVRGLVTLDKREFYTQELGSIADDLIGLVNYLESENQYQTTPIHESENLKLRNRARINLDGKIIITNILVKKPGLNAVPGEPLEVAYNFTVFNKDEKPVYTLELQGVSQRNLESIEIPKIMHDAHHLELKIYQDDREILIPSEQIPIFIEQLKHQELLGIAHHHVLNRLRLGAFFDPNAKKEAPALNTDDAKEILKKAQAALQIDHSSPSI